MMRYCYHESPIGKLLLAADESGLRRIAFPGRTEAEPDWAESSVGWEGTLRQLAAYFAGELRQFDLPLAPEGTAFQRRVWSELGRIPYGQTISYGELSRRIGNPGAARAVGLANGANPLPIVIPCHRVIGADGSLTGFGGGLEIKSALLDLEAGRGRLF